jgi:hypothetical protein
MSKPKRIQRSRAKGWKMPANAIYVGRPTVWENPYVVGSELMNGETLTAEKAVELYEQHLADNFSERDIRHCLHDKDLACWCALDEPCHADCCCGSRTHGRSSPPLATASSLLGKLPADFRKRTECATLLACERYSDYREIPPQRRGMAGDEACARVAKKRPRL